METRRSEAEFISAVASAQNVIIKYVLHNAIAGIMVIGNNNGDISRSREAGCRERFSLGDSFARHFGYSADICSVAV